MKKMMTAYALGAFLMGAFLMGAASAQPRKGVSVQMAVATGAVEMRAADEPGATVVAITAEGKVYVGVQATEPGALRDLPEETVYVKADSRTEYQQVLAVLSALRGKSVVLLSAPPADASRKGMVSPYGIKLNVPR